jgi:aconitate hydratase
MTMEPAKVEDIRDARILGIFLDSITTDHISPAGSIKESGPAGEFLTSHQVRPSEFNSYGARRGNHQVMMRGTFANIRIKNQMLPGVEGGVTDHQPSGDRMPIYDASLRYREEGVPLVLFAGREYGTGSSRDWAAKGPLLLGVRAVVTQSFERIHRSNLVGMGVLPLVFMEGDSWQSIGLTGKEKITFEGLADLEPRQTIQMHVRFEDGTERSVPLLVRIDTADELDYYRHGGILPYVLRNLVNTAA